MRAGHGQEPGEQGLATLRRQLDNRERLPGRTGGSEGATLEDELRAKLREPVPVPRPGMAEHVVTPVRRQQVRRRAALVVAVTLVFASSAFALSTPGGQRAIVTATPTSGCGTLTTGVVGAGGSGVRTRQFVVVLTNTDAESVCRVDPDVELSLIAEGRRLDVRLLSPVRDRGHVDLASGQALVLELVWDNWCDGDISAAQVRIELPGAATVETEPFQPAPSSCDPSRQSTLRVFQMGLSEADKADVPDELLPRPEGDEKSRSARSTTSPSTRTAA